MVNCYRRIAMWKWKEGIEFRHWHSVCQKSSLGIRQPERLFARRTNKIKKGRRHTNWIIQITAGVHNNNNGIFYFSISLPTRFHIAWHERIGWTKTTRTVKTRWNMLVHDKTDTNATRIIHSRSIENLPLAREDLSDDGGNFEMFFFLFWFFRRIDGQLLSYFMLSNAQKGESSSAFKIALLLLSTIPVPIDRPVRWSKEDEWIASQIASLSLSLSSV